MRLATAALLAISMLAAPASVSSARPSREELRAAEAQLASLNEDLSLLVEQYNQTKLALDRTEARLAAARRRAGQARAAADRARAYLSARAAAAYQNPGSGLEVLLGATSLSDFTSRLEFVNRVARDDADAAAQAELARQEARRASDRLTVVVDERTALLQDLDGRKASIESAIGQQQRMIAELEVEVARQEAAARTRANQQARQRSEQGSGDEPGPDPEPDPDPKPPPPRDQGADAAVAAAYSVLGTPYKWGGDDPEEGFDCSGLTMWSWAQGGVSLPHSSAAQYAVTARVSRDALQPGDLLFFYSPISHVSLYVGGNQMIHARHPGTVVAVEPITDYWWDVYVGAGRP